MISCIYTPICVIYIRRYVYIYADMCDIHTPICVIYADMCDIHTPICVIYADMCDIRRYV